MIYTMGNPVVYEPLFDNPEPPRKTGRKEGYPGGCTWKTYQEAAMVAAIYGYKVYGVVADWDKDTEPNENGKWNDLLVDSILIKLETE